MTPEEENYEVTIQKREGSQLARTVFIFLAIILVIAIPIFLLTYDTEPMVEEQAEVPVTTYNGGTDTPPVPETQKVLEQDTEILAQTVYGANGSVIGVLYDAYANPKSGDILWLSINEDNKKSEGLRLISVSNTTVLAEDEPVRINMTAEAFIDIPVQTKVEEELEDLISIRNLPGSTISDPQGEEVGNVSRVTYFDGQIDRVYFFSAREPEAEFYVPFEAFDYESFGNTYANDYYIELSERQAGAIDMYLQNTNQF